MTDRREPPRVRPRLRPGRRELALDAAWAAGLAFTGFHYAAEGPGPSAVRPLLPGGAPVMAVAVAATLALTLRRRYPLLVLGVVTAAAVLLLGTNRDLVFLDCLALGTALYSAAAYGPHRAATWAALPVAAGVLVLSFRGAAVPDLPRTFVGLLVLAPIATAAAGIRVRHRRAARETARRERAEAETARAAVERERARIARELHDVVTHHVGMMVIQAGAARMVLDTAPGDAREALLAVEATGRSALGELRDVLGLLGDDPAARLRPQPGLGTVPELVARIRDAGIAIDYRVVGEPRAVPDGIGLTAYRVAQEALTNVVRHAAAAEAAVVVEYAPDQLRIEVTDAGTDAGGATGSGHGLAGLRERVALHGGNLIAERRLGGGFRVQARLPLAAS